MTLTRDARRLMSWAPIHTPTPPADDYDTGRLLDFIAAAGTAGVTRNDIRERLFQRHKRAAAITALLAPLVHAGRITETPRKTNRRPATVYTLRNRKDT